MRTIPQGFKARFKEEDIAKVVRLATELGVHLWPVYRFSNKEKEPQTEDLKAAIADYRASALNFNLMHQAGRPRLWSEADIEKAQEMRRQGAKLREIGDHFGRGNVHRYVRGIKKPRK